MDMMQRMGGRKFLMALAVIGVAVYLEMTHGLSVNMAGFLVAIVGSFHIANYASTARYIDGKNGGTAGKDDDLHDKVDSLSQLVTQGLNPETQNQALALFEALGKNLQELRNITGQTGQAVVNLTREINKR